jgi:hypothetical protein
MANKISSFKRSAEIETKKRGSVNYKPNAEVPSERADVLTTKTEPKTTLGSVTKRETKVHRKRVLRSKVQKAK